MFDHFVIAVLIYLRCLVVFVVYADFFVRCVVVKHRLKSIFCDLSLLFKLIASAAMNVKKKIY